MTQVTNKRQSGFKGLAEYQEAYQKLIDKHTDFAWRNVQALEYKRENFALAVTTSMQGFARELKELDAKWINSNLETETKKPFDIFSVRNNFPELKEIHLNMIQQLISRYNAGELTADNCLLMNLPKHKINTPILEVFDYYGVPYNKNYEVSVLCEKPNHITNLNTLK